MVGCSFSEEVVTNQERTDSYLFLILTHIFYRSVLEFFNGTLPSFKYFLRLYLLRTNPRLYLDLY